MRVIGLDPGSGHFARCVLDVTATSADFVSCDVIEVGHMVQLRKPRKRKGGAVQTEERVVEAADIEQFASAIRGALQEEKNRFFGEPSGALPIQCACERRARISPRGNGGQVSAEMASQLATAKELGGGAVEIARFLGYRIGLVTPEEWRKALCGDSHADDKAVKAGIELAVRGCPKRWNPHERDAAGVALFAARRELVMTR